MLYIITFSYLYAQEKNEREKDQYLIIDNIIPGGSAEAVGLKPGDVIVTYNGQEVHCLKKLGMLKEEVETDSVEFIIRRDEELISFTIPKGMIGVWVKELLPDINFDKNAVIIEGVNPLGWDTGESSSFIAALTRIAEYLEIEKDYTYLMGTSASAFRIHFYEDWCPSSPDATVGFDCGSIAAQSINLDLEQLFLDEDGENKPELQQRITASVDNRMPVIAIDLIEVAEWGLIVGYQEDGEELVVRTYFDKREGYDIAKKFPWIIMTVSKQAGNIDDNNNFINSLEIAQELYETEKYEEYYSGTAAIEYWIKRLKEDDFDALEEERFNDIMLTNAWIFQRLADDRMLAAHYLKAFAPEFPHVKEKISELASLYETEYDLMTESTVTLYPNQMKSRDDWTDEMKQKEIEILSTVLEKEKEAYLIIKEINEKIY